jgi:hypothetical protein
MKIPKKRQKVKVQSAEEATNCDNSKVKKDLGSE